jgi:P4 family phage/plasmid primase-like protien
VDNGSAIHPITRIADYTSRGWPVFPCNTMKRPKTEHGFKDATLDMDEHKYHWTMNPDDTIGIATGFSNGSRLLVVDLDGYKDGGHPEWDALAEEHGGLPPTYTVQTGSGGRQHYFTISEPVRSTQEVNRGDGVKNVEIKADGGYVIGAGSVSVFGEYLMIDGRDPVPAPEWLLDFAKRTKSRAEGAGTTTTTVRWDESLVSEEEQERLNTYAEGAVKAVVGELAECTKAKVADPRDYKGPPWDATTFNVACNLIEIANSPWNNFTEDDAWMVLLAEAPRDAGFGTKEIQRKWDSARRKVGDACRPVPKNPAPGVYYMEVPGGKRGIINPNAFFGKEGLKVSALVQAVIDLGPLAIEDTVGRGIWKYVRGAWTYAPNEVSDRCAVLLGNKFRTGHLTNSMPPLQQRLQAAGMVIDCKPVSDYLNVANGMLDWRTGKLEDHDPKHLSTVQLPVEWDPDATCPKFDRFIADVAPEDGVDYLWEVIGYMLYNGNPLQKAILFHGAGANGKGTLIRVLVGLLGKRNTSSVTLADIADGKFEAAELFGKVANLAGDIDATYMKNTAKFKAITGEDQISVQRKYQHPFEFTCWATPLFSANEFWKSADTTTGYKRRWLLVPFPNTFEITPGFSEGFSDEYPGILVKAVAALQRMAARGKGGMLGDFEPPASALSEKEKFEIAADQVMEWLDDDTGLVVRDPSRTDIKVAAPIAYQQYRAWAEQNGTGFISAQKFRQRLTTSGYQYKKSNGWWILGLQINRQFSAWNTAISTPSGAPIFN